MAAPDKRMETFWNEIAKVKEQISEQQVVLIKKMSNLEVKLTAMMDEVENKLEVAQHSIDQNSNTIHSKALQIDEHNRILKEKVTPTLESNSYRLQRVDRWKTEVLTHLEGALPM